MPRTFGARAIAAAYDAGDQERLEQAAKTEAPVTVINELIRQSNMPITITIKANERVMASKNSGPEYSAAELSDGERNALLIAGSVLTAPEHSLWLSTNPKGTCTVRLYRRYFASCSNGARTVAS